MVLQPPLPLGQDGNNLGNRLVATNFREELINRILTWKFSLLLIGLLFMVATLNMTLFFVLRSAFTPPVSPLCTTVTVTAELIRELTMIRETVCARMGRNGTETSPVSCPSPTFTVPPELMRELTAIREAVNAKDGTQNSTCKEQSTVKKDNSVVSKSCGGIVSISRSQKGYLVNDKGTNERCAWIIKSEMMRIKVQYANHSLGRSSGTVIGEVGDGYVGLSCSKLSRTASQIVSTPFVVYFTDEDSRISFFPIKMVLELTPVDDDDYHGSQPSAYHVNKMSKSGALYLGDAAVTSRTLLDKITVFQTQVSFYGHGRQLVCSPTGAGKCCDYIDAYIMDDFSKATSCHKAP